MWDEGVLSSRRLLKVVQNRSWFVVDCIIAQHPRALVHNASSAMLQQRNCFRLLPWLCMHRCRCGAPVVWGTGGVMTGDVMGARGPPGGTSRAVGGPPGGTGAIVLVLAESQADAKEHLTSLAEVMCGLA